MPAAASAIPAAAFCGACHGCRAGAWQIHNFKFPSNAVPQAPELAAGPGVILLRFNSELNEVPLHEDSRLASPRNAVCTCPDLKSGSSVFAFHELGWTGCRCSTTMSTLPDNHVYLWTPAFPAWRCPVLATLAQRLQYHDWSKLPSSSPARKRARGARQKRFSSAPSRPGGLSLWAARARPMAGCAGSSPPMVPLGPPPATLSPHSTMVSAHLETRQSSSWINPILGAIGVLVRRKTGAEALWQQRPPTPTRIDRFAGCATLRLEAKGAATQVRKLDVEIAID